MDTLKASNKINKAINTLHNLLYAQVSICIFKLLHESLVQTVYTAAGYTDIFLAPV